MVKKLYCSYRLIYFTAILLWTTVALPDAVKSGAISKVGINSSSKLQLVRIEDINSLSNRNNVSFIEHPIISSQQNNISKRSQVLSLLLPWLYFVSISIMIPSFPKFINYVINDGNINVTPDSSKVYGMISGVDALFTLLSVNLVGCMSDSFGRKPFMLISALGLGSAYFLASIAKTPQMFYFGAMIDGLTSCMFSQAQSYIADLNIDSSGNNRQEISVALGRFQGIAIGILSLLSFLLLLLFCELQFCLLFYHCFYY